MLFAANTDLANALESSTRQYSIKLEADWDGTGSYTNTYSDLSPAVTDLGYDRYAGNDLPEEVTLVQGYQVGSLRATLEGDIAGVGVTQLLSTYQTTSPFYGEDLVGTKMRFTVTIETANGPVTVPQFIGILRAVEPRSGSRLVDIEILDLAGAMYAPIHLPLDGIYQDERVVANMETSTFTQWVVDHVLRRNEIYATPASPTGSILSVTGHGGLGAEIGWNEIPYTLNANTLSDYVDSVWPGMLATPGSWGSSSITLGAIGTNYFATESLDLTVTDKAAAVAGWFYVGGTMTNVAPAGERTLLILYPFRETAWRVFVTINDTGLLQAFIQNSAGTRGASVSRQLSGSESWRYIGLHIRKLSTANIRFTWRVAGTNTSGDVSYTAPDTGVRRNPAMFISLHRSWSNIALWKVAAAPTGTWPMESTAHVAQANIAKGMNRMTYMPELYNGNSLAVLTSAIQAEYGSFGFDEEGKFTFSEAQRKSPDTSTATRTLTAEKPLADLASERFLDSVRNVVTSATQPGFYNRKLDTIFDAESVTQFRTRTGGTTVYNVEIDPIWGLDLGYRTLQFRSAWSSDITQGWHAVRTSDVSLTQSTGVSVIWEQTSLRTAKIHVSNTSGYEIQFQSPGSDGQPALRMWGRRVRRSLQIPFEAWSEPSIEKYGRRSFGIAPGEWRSKKTVYDVEAGDILVQLRNPVTTLKQVPMLGDPRDQIGDLHKVEDPDGIGGPVYGIVQGIYRTWSKTQGFKQAIQYRVQKYETGNSYKIWPTGIGTSIVTYAGDTRPYNLATQFYVTSTCWITEIHYYRYDNSGTYDATEGRVYQVNDQVSGPPVDGTYVTLPTTGTGWVTRVLPKPIILQAGQHYRVTALYPKGFSYGQNYWTTTRTNGPLVAPSEFESDSGQGSFYYGTASAPQGYPDRHASENQVHLVDVTVVDTP